MKINIGKFTFSLKNGCGLSKVGYYHIPLIYLGVGKNGFGITIIGIFFGISYNSNNLK